MHTLATFVSSLLALSLALPAQEAGAPPQAPAKKRAADADAIAELLTQGGEDLQVFNDHVVTLANPFMEGRLPGTRGMEIASQYMEYWFDRAGAEPAFKDAKGSTPWRQPFPLGGTVFIEDAQLQVEGHPLALQAGADFIGTLLGQGSTTAEAVFVGYGIGRGPNDFSSVPDDLDLTGKIAVAFRFEPMDEAGKSKWATDGDPWSAAAGFETKLRFLQRRKVGGVVFVNPPGCADPRAQTLETAPSMTQRRFPVLQVSTAAGEKLVAALDLGSKTLTELRSLADAGGGCVAGKNQLVAGVLLGEKTQIAENVGALLPGKGALADQYIVIGAHLDHLGMGDFGSRSGPGKLHPGADDNATGSAALLMLADKLKRDYDKMAGPLRSILFLAFSAEESGLNGSQYYVRHPLVPLEQHALMINFDMIGRIRNKRLSVPCPMHASA